MHTTRGRSATSVPCGRSLPGGRREVYGPEGKHGRLDDLLFPIQHGVLHFVGMEVLPPFVAYGVEWCSPEERAADLEAYRERLLWLESTDPLEFSRVTRRETSAAAPRSPPGSRLDDCPSTLDV